MMEKQDLDSAKDFADDGLESLVLKAWELVGSM